MTEDLNRFGQPGEALIVSGEIRSAGAGEAGIDGARIEVWQTDGEGRYHPQGSGDVADYPSDAVDLRGTVVTDEAGVYRYRTVVPGAYPPRPRHFHYRITAPGHQTLVTQLYVSADAAGRQSGGDCRHAPIEAGEGGLTYRAPALYLQPG
jgi:protocatechuate 3,4-dioxygenase beta subunit